VPKEENQQTAQAETPTSSVGLVSPFATISLGAIVLFRENTTSIQVIEVENGESCGGKDEKRGSAIWVIFCGDALWG